MAALCALRVARDRIDRDCAGRLHVEALAASVGYSRAHFIRAFRAAYRETPGRYRRRPRIERARDLLCRPGLSVTEVCYSVGYESLGAFRARFRSIMGRSPSAYRALLAHRGDPSPIPACFGLMGRTGAPATADDGAHSKKRPGRAETTLEAASDAFRR